MGEQLSSKIAALQHFPPGQSFLVRRSPIGTLCVTPIEHPEQPRQRQWTPDPLALLGCGVAVTLLVGGFCFWLGYSSGTATVKAPVVIPPVCDTVKKDGLFWSQEERTCR